MKTLIKLALVAFLSGLFIPQAAAQQVKYKCMLQLTNYEGLEAYVIVSLVDAKGNYEKTLYVMGPDKQWYNGFKEWNSKLAKKKENLNGITGASVAAGDRSIATFALDASKMNKGYTLRFETAVEDNNYYVEDVVIALTTEEISKKTEGKGFIRYVKLNKL